MLNQQNCQVTGYLFRKLSVKQDILAGPKFGGDFYWRDFTECARGNNIMAGAGKNWALPRNPSVHSRISQHPRVWTKAKRYVRGERASYSIGNSSQRGRKRSTATQSLHWTFKKESKYGNVIFSYILQAFRPMLLCSFVGIYSWTKYWICSFCSKKYCHQFYFMMSLCCFNCCLIRKRPRSWSVRTTS